MQFVIPPTVNKAFRFSIPLLTFVILGPFADLWHSDWDKMNSVLFSFVFPCAKHDEHFVRYLLVVCISSFKNFLIRSLTLVFIFFSLFVFWILDTFHLSIVIPYSWANGVLVRKFFSTPISHRVLPLFSSSCFSISGFMFFFKFIFLFSSQPQFLFVSFSQFFLHLPSVLLTHSSTVSFQIQAGLPWISASQDILSCSETMHLLFY